MSTEFSFNDYCRDAEALRADPTYNAENYAPGSFGCHEALDRTALFAELTGDLVDHGAIIQNEDWLFHAALAAHHLAVLYQKIGTLHLMNEALLMAANSDAQLKSPQADTAIAEK